MRATVSALIPIPPILRWCVQGVKCALPVAKQFAHTRGDHVPKSTSLCKRSAFHISVAVEKASSRMPKSRRAPPRKLELAQASIHRRRMGVRPGMNLKISNITVVHQLQSSVYF